MIAGFGEREIFRFQRVLPLVVGFWPLNRPLVSFELEILPKSYHYLLGIVWLAGFQAKEIVGNQNK
jgi:hypothetical protein